MEQLAQALLLWISTNTGYSLNNIPIPVIKMMSAQEITQEFYSQQEFLIPAGGIDDRIYGLYDSTSTSNGVIYLRVDADTESGEEIWSSPILQERLLHELVHHVQFQSGAVNDFPCQKYGEKEAYMLGGRFLKQRYANDPMPNRRFWAHVYSRC